jgi:hypothetical protein
MATSLTCVIALVLLAGLVIWIVRKGEADRKIDAEFIEQAVHTGGRYKQSIRYYCDRPMRWIKSAANEYQLCSVDALLATLSLDNNGRLANGRSSEGEWVAQNNSWNTTCIIQRKISGLPEATRKSNIWTGKIEAVFADGYSFTFRDGRCYSAENVRLIDFSGRAVNLESAALLLPHLGLLVLVGSAMMLEGLDYNSGE